MRVPSSFTPEQRAEHLKAYEAQLAREHGALILQRADADLTEFDRLLFDRLMFQRFGVKA